MVYVFLANGFEEIEALATIDILRRAELSVSTVGVGGKIIVGAHNIPVIADIVDSEFVYDERAQMIVLPGGMPGTLNLEKSEIVCDAIVKANEDGKYIAAICAAPSVFGHKGLLQGKKACCFPGFEEQLFGAKSCEDSVVQDGNVITSRGAGTVYEFAHKLVEILVNKDEADRILASMLCKK